MTVNERAFRKAQRRKQMMRLKYSTHLPMGTVDGSMADVYWIQLMVALGFLPPLPA